jgi:3-oxoadipate enol-lactonase
MLGHEPWGNGAIDVIVLHDWMGDTSTWSSARGYLDLDRFSWHFADLRGYGKSKTLRGSYSLEEAAGDVLALADHLKLGAFAIVGHSMSTYVAMHLAQHHAGRVSRTVLLTPGPPAGFGVDEASLLPIQRLAHGDDETRRAWLQQRFGDRWSAGWVRFKLRQWRATSNPEAVAQYAALFACRGLPSPTARITIPVLCVTGERDVEIMRRESMTNLLSPICDDLTMRSIAESGHYPMQEAPPHLVTLIERFLAPPPASP